MEKIIENKQHSFRDFFAQTIGTVFVVTSSGELGDYGITLISVTSVTDTPPTLLFCVNQAVNIHNILPVHRKLCVNILNAQQANLANHFAGLTQVSFKDRLNQCHYVKSKILHQPRIQGAIAYKVIGTHTVFFVEAQDIEVATEYGNVLAYYQRKYYFMNSQNKESSSS